MFQGWYLIGVLLLWQRFCQRLAHLYSVIQTYSHSIHVIFIIIYLINLTICSQIKYLVSPRLHESITLGRTPNHCNFYHVFGGFLWVFFLFYLIRQILYIYNKKRERIVKKKVVSRSDFYDFFWCCWLCWTFLIFFEVYFFEFSGWSIMKI